jgi:histone deacetylase complex regulatory component SIN3
VYLPSQPKQPVEFDQAISYVNKIKKRFVVRAG